MGERSGIPGTQQRLPDEPRRLAWRGLMRVHAATVREVDQVLRERWGLSLDWYEALVELHLAGGAMRMSRFAEETTLSRSAATHFVDRLEEAGFVERRICGSDRRGFEVALTDAGRQAQRRAARVVLAEIQRSFGRHLEDAEAAALAGLLTGIVERRLASTPRGA